MFPEARPRRRIRRCMHCQRFFDSSSAAERVCPRCRRKHNKLLDQYGSIVTFESTPQMECHLFHVEEKLRLESVMSDCEIDAFLQGEDVDDSRVYRALIAEDKAKKDDEWPPPKAALSFLEVIINTAVKETANVRKTRKGGDFFL